MRPAPASYLLVALFFLTVHSYGQSSYSTDTSYVNELLKKGEAIETSKPALAVQNYTSAYKLAKKINFRRGYFDSVRLLTYSLNNVGRHSEAKRIAQEALQLAKTDTSKRNRSISHFALAHTALLEGNTKEAIPHYQQAAQYMRLLGKHKNVAVIYQNLGLIYEQQEMYWQAIDYYGRALQVDLKDTTDTRAIAIDYFSLGNIYNKQGKPDVAKQYYQKSRQFIDPQKDPDFLVSLYNNIGHIYENRARYDSALYYEGEALRISRLLNNPRHELHMLMTVSQTYNRMKRYDRAEAYLDKAYQIARREHAGLVELRNIYRNYVLLNEGRQNYKAAYQWYDKYSTIDDSLNNAETKELLQAYELKLKQAQGQQELAHKQRQIDQMAQERQRQRLWLLIAVLTAAVIGVGLLLGYLYYRQRERTAANALLATERERELAMVQSELQGQQKERLRISKEMHDDLGASLTAIGLLSEVIKTRMGTQTTPEVEKISSISEEMVTSMNEIIWSLNTKNDSLNGLIAYTRAYAREFIETTPLTLRTDVDESPYEITIRGADRRNVFLTVKEALNNAVKHARATQITLVIEPKADRLLIEVGDNGQGFSPNEQTRLRNGLANMQSRMAEAGGSCDITSSPAGTQVKITYPYAAMPNLKILQT